MHAEHGAVGHVPPADGRVVPRRVLVEHALRVLDVAAVLLLRRVRAEPALVGRQLLVLDRLGHRARAAVRVGDLGVDAHLAALRVVDGAHLEAVLVAADQARLAAAVARRARGHHRRLREDARAAVVALREGHRVLVVVREVEVAREPPLDRRVGAHRLDERARDGAVVVVEPAAAVDHVALLQHAQPRADDRRVREAEDVPAVLGRVLGNLLLEPRDLRVVDDDLVRGVLRRAELGRAEADQHRLLGDLVRELRRLLVAVLDAAELAQVRLEVGLVGEELVDALEVVVAADDVELLAVAVEVLGRQLVALGRAREERARAGAVLGLAEVAERHNKLVGVRLVEDLLEVVTALEGVVKIARVELRRGTRGCVDSVLRCTGAGRMDLGWGRSRAGRRARRA